ncbi:MAG: BspA family leucine-rich repeat surface protein [Muribaculaceae bacterium]|nr:BspA family leucine-rich repeat surface protein [Muribaculaceae bacterium]MCM1398966.1 BspA family leucine-rich repeat surface protein [Clostridium sp.]MCM1458824.1 BspA family leucine-rich repeat surface protein [Bacteroides sp.]
MAFSLKGSGSGKKISRGIASKEDIERYESIGYTHIVYEGSSHFVYTDDLTERDVFKQTIGLNNYEWFQEGTGNKNWVLYNPVQFRPDKNWKGKKILKFNKDDYKGGRFEVPINSSSCCGMFSWTTLPENFKLDTLFNTKDIVDMNLMFAGSILPDVFTISERFTTNNVRDMRYMFYECVLPEKFTLNDNFNTSKVEEMDFMFSECRVPKNFRLPDTFDTSSVKSMDHMFYETVFSGKFDFGNAFKINEGVNTKLMFTDSVINNETVDPEKCEDFAYMKKLLAEQ